MIMMEHTFDDISVILTELSAYRKSAICVRMDFEKKILQWKDSIRWTNNFVRSLSPECVQNIRESLVDTDLLAWEKSEEKDTSNFYLSRNTVWNVSVVFYDGSLEVFGGETPFPPQWQKFQSIVEKAARLPFKI